MFYLSFGIVGDYFTFFIKILHMYNIILSVGMGNFATIDLYVLNIKLSILVCRQVAVKRMEQGRMGKCV